MSKRLYIGNLPWKVDNQQLAELFRRFGQLKEAAVVIDKEREGRSRGFGFVEFADENAAKAALEAMDGASIDGRPLQVAEARPKH
jgi:RNA recognition motif-containing protein